MLCLLVFAATATSVYRWGGLYWTPVDPRPTFTATAYVVPMGASAEARLPMQHTDSSSQSAVESANSLADRYVDDLRAEWKRRTEGPYLLAREAADKAQREHAQDVTRLETFRRQLDEAAAAAAKARLANRPAKPQPAAMIDNPQWLALDRQLGELQQRRDEMLVSRTPVHPAVQDLDTRITGLKDQLAATTRQIPRGRADEPGSADPALSAGSSTAIGGADSPATQLLARADQEKLESLGLAAEKSGQACDDAESAVKKTLQQQEAGPQFTIEAAQVVENPPPVDYGWRRLMATTLLSALLMAFGVGSLSMGARHRTAGGQHGRSAGRHGRSFGGHDSGERSLARPNLAGTPPIVLAARAGDHGSDSDRRVSRAGNLGRDRHFFVARCRRAAGVASCVGFLYHYPFWGHSHFGGIHSENERSVNIRNSGSSGSGCKCRLSLRESSATFAERKATMGARQPLFSHSCTQNRKSRNSSQPLK